MGDIWWKAHPQDLHRLVDRVSSVYVERSHLDRDENAVVVINKRETVRIPAAMVAVMLLGPGTRVTHGAMGLLADSGTAVCWVGEQGVRMYAAGLGPSRGAGLLHRQAWLVTRPKERLGVARAMYGMRFPGEDVSTATMQQLRGREGARFRKLYKGLTDERDARVGLRDQIAETKLLSRIVTDVKGLLNPPGTDFDTPETSALWDERLGTVSAGVNYAATAADFADAVLGDEHIAVTGPELDDETGRRRSE
ncbi:CRISPR-associated endonuclease Cas1 [Streptomyces sp. NPDC056500]|uniref:CRISPR-associated endonuclease Cas1 n=1 Tax=Streptomyces sp. NPDC056500 TaxID=3345840 RepID=UPI0036B4132F